MAGIDNLTPFDSERASAAGKIGGANKKGSKHINTHIQEILEDETFEIEILDPKVGFKRYQDRPVKAIVTVLTRKALAGDMKAADLLMKYGWNQKMEIEHSGGIETGIQDPVKADEFKEFLKGKTKQ